MTSELNEATSSKPTIRQYIKRAFGKLIRWSLSVVGLYLLAVIVGLIPVNGNFVPSNDPDAVSVFVFSGPVHTDLILPVRTATIDWGQEFPTKSFKTSCSRFSHVAIGWGDRGFYLDTPTWRELKASTALNAMLISSDSVMHVNFMNKPHESNECRQVQISRNQYLSLTNFIQSSFARTDGGVSTIPGKAYLETDAFFVGVGSYHALNTCNCWAARGLAKSGVKVPWFSPLPRTVLWYLPPGKDTLP